MNINDLTEAVDYKSPIEHVQYEFSNLKIKERKIFNKLYDECVREIIKITKQGGNEYFYELPKINIDYPSFDPLKFAVYMINKLRSDGFFVLLPNIDCLYIRFSMKDENEKKRKRIEFLTKEYIKTKLFYKLNEGFNGLKYMKIPYNELPKIQYKK